MSMVGDKMSDVDTDSIALVQNKEDMSHPSKSLLGDFEARAIYQRNPFSSGCQSTSFRLILHNGLPFIKSLWTTPMIWSQHAKPKGTRTTVKRRKGWLQWLHGYICYISGVTTLALSLLVLRRSYCSLSQREQFSTELIVSSICWHCLVMVNWYSAERGPQNAKWLIWIWPWTKYQSASSITFKPSNSCMLWLLLHCNCRNIPWIFRNPHRDLRRNSPACFTPFNVPILYHFVEILPLVASSQKTHPHSIERKGCQNGPQAPVCSPTRFIICGPAKGGKSRFVFRLMTKQEDMLAK